MAFLLALHFFYDASNKPAIVEYNGMKYAYVHNLQGDIVAILDSSKKVVVSYVYDAWGRPIKKEGSLRLRWALCSRSGIEAMSMTKRRGCIISEVDFTIALG